MLFDRSKPVYKFVDPAVADIVAAGSLRIGTLRSYGRLESARADPHEASAILNAKVQNSALLTNEQNALLAYHGINISGRNNRWITIEGHKTSIVNLHCLCFSDCPDAGPPEAHAVFEVADVMDLASTLTAMYEATLGPACQVGKIEYASRDGGLDGKAVYADPFVKPPSFSWEKEIRMIWLEPRRDRAALTAYPPGGGIERFDTPSSSRVSGLLRRIR